jgi:glucosamine--fructose-6-phosphate aminotransferase (isomerizing)
MISGIREVASRGARVLTITTKEIAEKFSLPTDNIIAVDCNGEDEIFAPFAVTTCFQMLAYHVSALRGNDVDKTRNLAKSVTVE